MGEKLPPSRLNPALWYSIYVMYCGRHPLASDMHTSQAIVTSDIIHNVLNDVSDNLVSVNKSIPIMLSVESQSCDLL